MIQRHIPFDHELIIDNFAGGGGTSVGLEQAFGRPVDIAINHDPEALAMHAINHPQTLHLCQSVWDVDPIAVTQNRPVALVWLSPDCKHFSKAKGGTPVSKRIRGLAWVGMRWVALCKPRVLMLENVEEFKTWGPLIIDEDGNARPDPARKGKTFESFVRQLRAHGYTVDWRELRACDYGAPTIRKRLFLIARRDGLPIVWPKPTHGEPTSRAVLAGKLQPYRTAADCIDWSLPCPSIFLSKEEGKALGVRRPLADATLRRIASGVMRYVVNSAEPFIVSYYGQKREGEFRGQALSASLNTQTTENRFGLVVPKLAPVVVTNTSGHAPAPMHEPLATITTGGHHMLVSAFLAKHYTGVVGSDVRDSIGTITAVDHHSLVTSHLVKLRNNGTGQDARRPLDTLTASGQHFGEVRAFLVKFYSQGGQWQSLDDPMHTIPTKDRLGLVMVRGEPYAIMDIGMRMLKPRELYRAQGFPDSYVIEKIPDPDQLFADGVQASDPLSVPRIPLSAAAQVRMCGNSVSPPAARALVEANFLHELELQGEAA